MVPPGGRPPLLRLEGVRIHLRFQDKSLINSHSTHTIDFAAPKGPNPPVDQYSVKMFTDDESVKFLQDPEVKQKLENAKKLSDVDPKDYDAIFYVGG